MLTIFTVKQVEFELIENEEDMAEKYMLKVQSLKQEKQERMNSLKSKGGYSSGGMGEESKQNSLGMEDRQLSLMPKAGVKTRHDYLRKRQMEKEARVGDDDDIQDIDSSDESGVDMEED